MNDSRWSAPSGPWKGDGIAIVGMAGRFPMAESVSEFWRNLLDDRDCVSRFSREELVADGVAPSMLEQERFVPAGAVLDRIEDFDAAFFGISPREAESMDPQQRLFLEVAQHAFDDAGFDPTQSRGPVAVYAGCRLSGYWMRLMRLPEFMNSVGWHQVAAGNDKDFLPTQVSFRFDLRGPSINVQAACSTSLLAVSLGCDALIAGRCDVALAGAASIAVPQRTGYLHQPSSIASSDGHCRPFDAKADGSVLGNAVAAVVLKRVEDAEADGDRIYAVIRSVAVNNDGSSKSSFAAPSLRAQTEVIARAVADAGLSPRDIGYVEAHGTGTLLGDPIEVAALARVFGGSAAKPAGAQAARGDALLIGSVKSNVGHLDPVAGLASLIKGALCLHEEQIPSTLHFVRPNPAIDFESLGVRVVQQRTGWPRGDSVRRAGVSAFGIGGTNVHAVLEEAPLRPEACPASDAQLLVVSAKSTAALHDMRSALAGALGAPGAPCLSDAAFTLACGRRQFKHRSVVVASSLDEAVAALARAEVEGPRFVKDRPVVLLFPGQGSQRMGMGAALYRAEPVFRETVDEVFALARPWLGFDGRGLVDPRTHGNGTQHDPRQTAIAQPLLFAIELASARLWMHWGVQPQQMLGHSLGEWVAAQLAGVFSLADAVRAVCERGRLMQAMPAGAMLAVSLDEDTALALVDDALQVAAFNAPRQQTVSGSIAAIDGLEKRLRSQGVDCSRLATSHAFHHRSMEEAAGGLGDLLGRMSLAPPQRSFMSCLTGRPIETWQAIDPDYWARSLMEPVRFSAAARYLLQEPDSVFIECGAGRALGSLLRAHAPATGCVIATTIDGTADGHVDHRSALTALGHVWQSGVEVDWSNVWRDRSRRRVSLPGYAFQRTRHWIDAPAERSPAQVGTRLGDGGGAPQRSVSGNCFARTWAPSAFPDGDSGVIGTWIVLADDGGLGAALAERLRGDGTRVIRVKAGRDPQQRSTDDVIVDPAVASSIQAMIDQLTLPVGPVHVVNAWTADWTPGPLALERCTTGVLLGLQAPLRLLRALTAHGRPATSLHALTTRLFPIGQGEWPEAAAASALGLVRVLPQELAGFRSRIVDVLVPASPEDSRKLVGRLVAELRSNAVEPVVAYRGDQRLVESFAQVELPLPRLGSVVRAQGTYLVTGGFGGIGGVLAKALARTARIRLVLIGRHGPGAADERAREAQGLVDELQAMGAVVVPVVADVADASQVHRVVAELQSRFGRFDGVIHAAGIPGGRMLMMPEPEQPSGVLAAKLAGTIALLESTAAHRPDFIVLCSSFATVAGGVGQGEYSAANAFVDAAAWTARALGLKATAVAWPAWRDVGMAHSMSLPGELEHLRRASLESGITSDEGVELFSRILGVDLPQVVVAPFGNGSAPAAAASSTTASGSASTSASIHAEPGADGRAPSVRPPAPSAGSEGGSTEQLLVARIGSIWSSVLGVPAPQAQDNFFELGGQSLMALQIVSRVGVQFGVQMNLADIFDHATLEDFSAFVHRRMVEHVASLPDEQVHAILASQTTP